jgi:hypothetical protein
MSKNLYVGFYRGSGFDSKLIQRYTDSLYSHVALVETNQPGDITYWTLYEAAYGAGVVVRQPMVNDRDKWDLFELPQECDNSLAIEFVNSQVGKGYDYLGIFIGQFLKIKSNHPNKWFCSELISKALNHAGLALDKKPAKYDPGKFYRAYFKELVLAV